MTTLAKNEEILLTSNNNSIILTNHRIIYKTTVSNQEMFLKDIVGHEIVYKKSNYFLGLAIAGIVVLILVMREAQFTTSRYGGGATNARILLILISIFLIGYFRFTKKLLKISGRYNNIEFSVRNLSQDSLNNFINRISVESDNRKKE